MLAEGYELGDDVDDSEACGCLVKTVQIDGRDVQVHHFLPDDFAPHVPESECGCGPVLHQRAEMLVYEHIDQDDLPQD